MTKFYRAFEDKFRGPPEIIRNRLEQYKPFLKLLLKDTENPVAVDLGCGRGEWLSLVKQAGLRGVGVDLDEGMLEEALAQGVDARQEDALSYLQSLGEHEVDIVSAFHLVEHLPFNTVRQIIAESYRVLRPGGLIILETPNPENFSVGTSSFYLDPTHNKPLPPDLLQFAVKFTGFEPAPIIRLQGEVFSIERPPTIEEVIFGSSRDYSVVGQKPSHDGASMPSELYGSMTGLSGAELASRFDSGLKNLASRVQALDEMRSTVDEIHADFAGLRSAVHEAQVSIVAFQHDLTAARFEIARLEGEVVEANRSKVRRLTAAIREMGRLMRYYGYGLYAWMTLKPGTRPRRLARRALFRLSRIVLARPALARSAKRVVRRFPALEKRLANLIAHEAMSHYGLKANRLESISLDAAQVGGGRLSPSGLRVLRDLKLVIDQRDI